MKADDLHRLVQQRWSWVKTRLGTFPPLTWDFGHHEHFDEPRGFAVTLCDDETRSCELLFAEKILRQPFGRIDGVLRHELGHVVDFFIFPKDLNQVAWFEGKRLPKTTERRADAIAEWLWKAPIYYDDLLVQNTESGVRPRPDFLGL